MVPIYLFFDIRQGIIIIFRVEIPSGKGLIRTCPYVANPAMYIIDGAPIKPS